MLSIDSKTKALAERFLSKKVISGNRIGGFSANNYLVKVDNNRRFVVKILRDNANEYFDKLEKNTKLLKERKTIPFKSAKILDRKNKIAIFPYVRGNVLHGGDITEQLFQPIVNLLIELKQTKPLEDTLHSATIYLDVEKSKKQIKELLNTIKKQRNDTHSETLINILNLKKSILKKYGKDLSLSEWLEKSNDFVHGDFHNENILFEKGKIKAALDFELAHRGNSTEDALNFVWFAFLNNDFSDKNIKKSADFLKMYKRQAKVKNIDIENAFKLTFIRFVQSTVLEKSLLELNEGFYAGLLQRDYKKFRDIDSNFETIKKKLLA